MRFYLVAAVVLVAAGCGFDSTKPINTRDRALDAAKWAYTGARQQGYDMRASPCIFSNGGSWIVVVDVTGKRSVSQVIRLCGLESSGFVRHAVVLDLNGRVLIAR